jgi:O-antigen/teichoic acid export membrane protein
MVNLTNFLKGSAFLTASSILVRVSGILVLIPLTRLLNSEELGIYTLMFWVVQSLTNIGRFGVDITLHRNGAKNYQSDPISTGRLLGTGFILMIFSFTILSLCLWIWRLPLAEHWLAQKEVAKWLAYSGLLNQVEGLGIIILTGLLSLHSFQENTIATSAGAIARLLLCPLLAWKYQLAGALGGLILASLIQLITGSIFLFKKLKTLKIKLSCQNFWNQSKEILKFGLPFWAGNAFMAFSAIPIMGEINRIAGVAAIGDLRIAQSLCQLVSFLPSAITPVTISILSETYTEENNQDYIKFRSLHFRSNWLFSFPIATFLGLASYSIVKLLFGDEFISAIPLVILMSWWSLLTIVVENFNLYSLSAGNTILIAISSISQKILVIGFSLLLIPQLGGAGYAMGLIIGGLVQLIIMIVSSWKKFGQLFIYYLGKILLFSFASCIISFLYSKYFGNLSLLLSTLISLAVTIMAMFYVTSITERNKVIFLFNKYFNYF